MGRLKSLPPRLAALPARLTAPAPRDDHGHSVEAEPGRAWYGLKRWRDPKTGLRMEVLERDGFTCQCGCGVMEHDTAKLVADHIVPHRGDPALFWDPANLQTLRASPCHNKVKQAQERRARALGHTT